MRENWLASLYQRIQEERNERLSRVLRLLRKKEGDPDIQEVIDLLSPWLGEQEHLAEEPGDKSKKPDT